MSLWQVLQIDLNSFLFSIEFSDFFCFSWKSTKRMLNWNSKEIRRWWLCFENNFIIFGWNSMTEANVINWLVSHAHSLISLYPKWNIFDSFRSFSFEFNDEGCLVGVAIEFSMWLQPKDEAESKKKKCITISIRSLVTPFSNCQFSLFFSSVV